MMGMMGYTTIENDASGFSKKGHVFGDVNFAVARTSKRKPAYLAEANDVREVPGWRMSREATPNPNFSSLSPRETTSPTTRRISKKKGRKSNTFRLRALIRH